MATVSHDALIDNWTLPDALFPPESIDPFADDDNLGLLGLESGVPAPAEPKITFAEFIEIQAAYYRSKGGPAALWLAKWIEEGASWARRLNADGPDEFEARYEVEIDALHASIFAEGYDSATAGGEGPYSRYLAERRRDEADGRMSDRAAADRLAQILA